jgi:hypothetical protein
MQTYGGVRIYLHAFLISAVDGGDWLASKTEMFYCRGKNHVTQWIGGWVDVRACMNFVKKRKLCSPWIRILAL